MKLIRDKLALTPFGDRQVIMVDRELQQSLIFDKVLEEAFEVHKARSNAAIEEELADLFEVLDRLLVLHQISHERIRIVRAKKYEERGGFEKGYALI